MSATNLPDWYIHDIARKVSEALNDDKMYTRLLSGSVEVYSLTNNLVVRVLFNGSGFFYDYSAHRIQDLDKTTGAMTRSSCVYTSDNPDGIATREPEMDKIAEVIDGLEAKEIVISQVSRTLERHFNNQGCSTSVYGSTIWVKADGIPFAENWGSFAVADDLVVWICSSNHLKEITDALKSAGFKVRNQDC